MKIFKADREDYAQKQDSLRRFVQRESRHILRIIFDGVGGTEQQHEGAEKHDAAQLDTANKYVPRGIAHTQHSLKNRTYFHKNTPQIIVRAWGTEIKRHILPNRTRHAAVHEQEVNFSPVRLKKREKRTILRFGLYCAKKHLPEQVLFCFGVTI